MHDNACNFNKKTEFQNIVTKTKKYIEKNKNKNKEIIIQK